MVEIVGEDGLFKYVQTAETENEGKQKVPLTKEDILSAAGIKKGSSTLLINKTKAATKIEQAYPYVKVIQISTTGVSTIKIRLTCRYEMFYYKLDQSSSFYVLDEDLKVLNITQIQPNLPQINPTSFKNNGTAETTNILKVTNQTKVGDFLTNGNFSQIISSLYVSMYRSVLLNEQGNLRFEEAETTHYATRQEISTIITNITFKIGNTLEGNYQRIVLATNCGIKIDIGKPEEDLLTKVNICFSSINQMSEEDFSRKGTIMYGYDENGEIEMSYIFNNQTV